MCIGDENLFYNATDDKNVVLSVDWVELDTVGQYLEFYDFGNTFPVNSFKIFHTNIRSFSNNFDEMLLYIQALNTSLDIIVFSECWLSCLGRGVSLEGFDVCWAESQLNQNDGVIVYVNKRLTSTCEQITLGNMYVLSLNCCFLNVKFNLLFLYRNFDSDMDIFIDGLAT